MPVFVFLRGLRQRLRQFGKVQQAELRRLLELRDHLLYGAQSVPALELLQRGDENFELGYLFLLREQRFRLDIQKVRRHLHELAGDLKVELLHLVKIFEILVEYLGDFDIAYLDLIF